MAKLTLNRALVLLAQVDLTKDKIIRIPQQYTQIPDEVIFLFSHYESYKRDEYVFIKSCNMLLQELGTSNNNTLLEMICKSFDTYKGGKIQIDLLYVLLDSYKEQLNDTYALKYLNCLISNISEQFEENSFYTLIQTISLLEVR